ncbi:MAG: helicase-related protein [Candidatus Pacebacteria bacterium]|nr:helicase-related protein [Candidatus Paceibacterota bacterium]
MEPKKNFKSLEDIRPGDCIVCFNYNDIFTFKEKIEKLIQRRKEAGKPMEVTTVLPIFGSLPQETKVAAISSFNAKSSKSCIVATDAIGMGMNLHIRRIIFSSAYKMNRLLTTAEIKQIAGRAGRYAETGYVNTLQERDWEYIKRAISKGTSETANPNNRRGSHPGRQDLHSAAKAGAARVLGQPAAEHRKNAYDDGSHEIVFVQIAILRRSFGEKKRINTGVYTLTTELDKSKLVKFWRHRVVLRSEEGYS